MPTITTKDGVEIFYKDWGKGQPIVFSHGWPLSSDDWDTQMIFFVNNGFRVVAHDRRGHGRSSQVADGHDMDHYADDLAALTALVSLYLNVFVLVIQSFLKVPVLHALAPSVPPAEPPFAVAQGIVLVFFVIVIIGAIRRYRPVPVYA